MSAAKRAAIRTWHRRTGATRPFLADQQGATAVEFALVAVPFFGLLFAIVQVALVFWSTQVLETAVANASRQIYTGQFQNDPNNTGQTASQLQGRFKDLVCANVTGLFDCASMVSVDVQTFSSFSSANVPSPVTNGKYDTSGYGYVPPARNDIVVVRASMEYPTYVTIMNPATSLSNGKQLVMASATFRTEPF